MYVPVYFLLIWALHRNLQHFSWKGGRDEPDFSGTDKEGI